MADTIEQPSTAKELFEQARLDRRLGPMRLEHVETMLMKVLQTLTAMESTIHALNDTVIWNAEADKQSTAPLKAKIARLEQRLDGRRSNHEGRLGNREGEKIL